jgi:hypothetical protein
LEKVFPRLALQVGAGHPFQKLLTDGLTEFSADFSLYGLCRFFFYGRAGGAAAFLLKRLVKTGVF